MPGMPRLRVVPLDSIRRHEEIDPLRVERLSGRIEAEGIQVNPMVCIEAPGGELVLLDGATRTESLKQLGLQHAVVQIVDPGVVGLGTWHHVVRGCSADELLGAIAAVPTLTLVAEGGAPQVKARGGTARHVLGDGMSINSTLTALVNGYIGKWNITRTIDPQPEPVAASYPDWAAIVEFPTLSVDEVMEAAVSDDLLPAGITRFKVPERALRLNIPLALLESVNSATDKQAELDALLDERARNGRIRRYEEPVFVLDD